MARTKIPFIESSHEPEGGWLKAFQPLFTKFGNRPHPLTYKNRYQLLIKVILSAQDSDRNINLVGEKFFEKFPTLEKLAEAKEAELFELLRSVKNWYNKAKWIVANAKKIGAEPRIPSDLKGLVSLSGVGRKSANVIISETSGEMEGVIVDLHTIRVAPRLGIANGDDPEKIEKQLMKWIPKENWKELGMSLTFLGREICRPTGPKCDICPAKTYCKFFLNGLT